MHTPDDHGAPSRTDGATRRPGWRFVAVALGLIIVFAGAAFLDPAALWGALLPLLADRIPEKAKHFVSGLLQPLNGCRACEA